jgi:hypothetical protein
MGWLTYFTQRRILRLMQNAESKSSYNINANRDANVNIGSGAQTINSSDGTQDTSGAWSLRIDDIQVLQRVIRILGSPPPNLGDKKEFWRAVETLQLAIERQDVRPSRVRKAGQTVVAKNYARDIVVSLGSDALWTVFCNIFSRR